MWKIWDVFLLSKILIAAGSRGRFLTSRAVAGLKAGIVYNLWPINQHQLETALCDEQNPPVKEKKDDTKNKDYFISKSLANSKWKQAF